MKIHNNVIVICLQKNRFCNYNKICILMYEKDINLSVYVAEGGQVGTGHGSPPSPLL